MEINLMLVAVAAVAQFILGGLWYSPLMFGRWWMEIMEKTHLSKDELQAMQKSMMPFYALQFVLAFLTTAVLAMFIHYLLLANVGFHTYGVAGWVWLGFVAPIQIGSVVWGNTKRQFWIKQLFVMLSFQLVGIMIAAFILSF